MSTTFRKFLAEAAAGETYCYARGNLAGMRHDFVQDVRAGHSVSDDLRRQMREAADAWDACEDGRVLLVQRREGEDDHLYLAVMTRGEVAARSRRAAA